MILTGPEITRAVHDSEITLTPFDPAQVNPNSYNYRLSPTLKTITSPVSDPRAEPRVEAVEFGEDGLVLQPGIVYLGTTVEQIGSCRYVPSLIGRSSLGRLGLFLQISADLGQLGACHRWTLEIVATQPIRIYPRMIVGQVSFWVAVGAAMPYAGYYGNLDAPAPCDPYAAEGRGAHREGVAA